MISISRLLFLPAALAIAAPCFSTPARAAPGEIPAWLKDVCESRFQPPEGAPAMVLLDEAVSAVAPGGRITTTARKATRILSRDGAAFAEVALSHDASTWKITAFRAWLVRPDGTCKTYHRDDANDVPALGNALYTDARRLVLSAGADACENCVFAYEFTRREDGSFGQGTWRWQAAIPVVLSRVTYKVPAGWTVAANMTGRGPVAPVVEGNTFTWQMRDLPAVKEEPMGPGPARLFPLLNIDIAPPKGMAGPPLAAFPDWAAVSKLLHGFHHEAGRPDDAITAKTRELLAGTGPGLWDRIAALARHAQEINYVSIAMNLWRGGGITPRPAREVLRTGYGDCKDKTAFLRAMLSAAGIESLPVAVYAGDRWRVDTGWPSPGQFNHVIVAIKMDDPEITSPVMMEHPEFGRLLFFDPTDSFTPPGDLPIAVQGSPGLVIAKDGGGLARLPFTPPEMNHTERAVSAVLDATGAITARLTERMTGQTASRARAMHRLLKADKHADTIRRWLNETVRDVRALAIDIEDAREQGALVMGVGFAAPGHARMLRDRMLVFSPVVASPRNMTPLLGKERAQPVALEPVSFSETTELRLPDGFTVAELPPDVETETHFGRYSMSCRHDGEAGTIRCKRALLLRAVEIPARDYAGVREFFETVQKTAQTPVVLEKQPAPAGQF